MKQEYLEKMDAYQNPSYKEFLKSKNVLDAWQFLHSSMLYLNYAIITEKLYKDIGMQSIAESGGDPLKNIACVLGFGYNAHTLLNKCALEWFAHISNSLDCLLQYVNASLHLGLNVKCVGRSGVLKKLGEKQQVIDAIKEIWKDPKTDKSPITHIRSIYNYSKHTLDLYGGSSIFCVIDGRVDIQVPAFRYRTNLFERTPVSYFMDYYKTFIGLYLSVLDAIDNCLRTSDPVSNRWHAMQVKLDKHSLGETKSPSDIVLNAAFASDGKHIARIWIENPPFDEKSAVEIMPPHNKSIGQHIEQLKRIEVIRDNQVIGALELSSESEDSTLSYCKYTFTSFAS